MLDALFGNATETPAEKLKAEFEDILIEEEEIQRAFKVMRDMYVFTNKRLVLVDRQGLTGHKVEYHSIPYRSITHYAVETAGRFDMDAELKIWITGNPLPIEKEFKKGTDILGLQKTLTKYLLK